MRIFRNAYELMSEIGRELNSYGQIVKPKTYQNKVIEGNDDFVTKEVICQQYCLTSLPDPEWLFVYTNTKDWADAEFEERIDRKGLNPGEAWKLNKDMWEQFLAHDETGEPLNHFDYTYSQRINYVLNPSDGLHNRSKLDGVINLLKNDPDTRKAIINIFTTYDTLFYDGSRRIPCSIYYDFLIREDSKGDKRLHICYHQRSSDFVQHFGDDVYLAWKLMDYIAREVGVKPGYLYHTIDSLHSYKKDWRLLQTSIDDIK